jgi:histidine triad (HIT) family protein
MSQQPTPEQIKELQEKIAKMSPEELKEFQKKQCIFCHIIAGKVQSRRIYEDDTVLGILDINPANPGHILLLPKEHYSILPQLPEDVMEHIFLVAKKLSNTLLRAVDAQGSNILVANGIAAGQKAQHFMVHIIPRKEKDGVQFELPQKQIPEDKLQEMAELLAKGMGAPKPKREFSLLGLPSLKKKMEEAAHEEHHERKGMHHASHKHDHTPHPKHKEEPHKTTEPHDKKEKKHDEKQDITLDDIAKLFGGKK